MFSNAVVKSVYQYCWTFNEVFLLSVAEEQTC
jgi:hypothetical protein